MTLTLNPLLPLLFPSAPAAPSLGRRGWWHCSCGPIGQVLLGVEVPWGREHRSLQRWVRSAEPMQDSA